MFQLLRYTYLYLPNYELSADGITQSVLFLFINNFTSLNARFANDA